MGQVIHDIKPLTDSHLVPLADPLLMVPFVRDGQFVGREDVLSQIDERFHSVRRVSLAGIGGVGYESNFCT